MKILGKYNWLVTGGSGFIGTAVTRELLKQGQNLVVFDHNAPLNKNIKYFKGDLNDTALLKKALKNIDYVLHLAAKSNVAASFENPHEVYQSNVLGTYSLLLAAKKAGVKRVVFSSSASVYGNSKERLQQETHRLYPVSPYALSKVAGEEICLFFNRVYGLSTVVLRYFNVYGPRIKYDKKHPPVVNNFVNALKLGTPINIDNKGHQKRDFIFVDDLASANIKAATTAKIDGKIYNIASGSAVSIKELVILLEKASGKKAKINYLPERKGDIANSKADISAAKKDLKFNAKTTLIKGLKKTYEA